MSGAKYYDVLALLAAVISGSLVLALLGGLFVNQNFWLTRLATVAIALTLVTAATFILVWPMQQCLKAAHRYFDHLGRIAPGEIVLQLSARRARRAGGKETIEV